MSSYGKNPKSQFLRTSSINSISETGENTTEKVRKSLKVDTKGYELTEEEKLFSQEYDEWDKKDFRKTFTLTTTSKALKEIGIVEKNITMDGVKILRILKEHPQMTDDVIKKIPSVILDPVLILQSKTSTSRVVMSGELYDADNNPVVVILELEPKGKRGLVLDEIKVASAYGKESMQNLVNTSVIRYVNPDNTKTSRWLKGTRLQLPFGSTSAGSMESIPSNNNVVKKDLKYSLNGPPKLVHCSTQQICIEKDILSVPAYKDLTTILQIINKNFDYGTDMEFAKKLFNIPLPDRYQWLEDKVDDSLRKMNASFEDYNEVIAFVNELKGGF